MQNNHFLTALPVEPHTVCGTPPPEWVQIEFSALPSSRNIELTSRLQDTYILPLLFIFVKRYTLELYNDYSYLALYKFFDLHSCLNVDI